MTLREGYEYGTERLHRAGVRDAKLDAWYLLEFVTGVDRAGYYMNDQAPLGKRQKERYKECIRKRAERIPLQHITGVQEFMGLEFCVNDRVLVPRQDTEILAESVLRVLTPRMRLLDLCTGSGCILISLMKLGNIRHGVGTDLSKDALETARRNCEKHGVKARLIHSDLFENIGGRYDVIVSNPPYIPTRMIGELDEEVRLFEPQIALDGKEDGLYFYREIVRQCPSYLTAGGRLFFEIGHDQGEAVKEMMERAGFAEVAIKKDLAGLDRMVSGKYNG